jgi:diguanylate cyclase (GGDEF)-like protein
MEEQLTGLRRDYVESVSDKIGKITVAWQSLLEGSERQSDILANIRYHAHRLSGGAVSFGFTHLGEEARALEDATAELIDSKKLSNSDHDRISQLITNVKDAAEHMSAEDGEGPAPISETEITNTVLVLGEIDEDTLNSLRSLEAFGYRVRHIPTLTDKSLEIGETRPVALMADISLLDFGMEKVSELMDINRWNTTPPPLVVISDRDDFRTRLKALRSGAEAFLVWPVADVDIVDMLDRLAPPTGTEPLRVLVVDDEESLARYYTMILEAAGMECMSISNPTEVLSAATSFDPEIILTDLYMPLCSGDELAAVLRQKEEFDGVPIIFISGEVSSDAQFLALRRGADDFLTKPVNAADLVAAITTRGRRFRNLRARISQDSLTGLLNHTTIKSRLEVEMSRTLRTGQPMSFALIDIDHFKRVNDSYGHPTGDRVIKTLSRMLVQRLRKTDIIGRYGGEEFAAILPGADAETARGIIDDFRNAFSEVAHISNEGSFTCSFSCGIAEFRSEDSDLTELADEALYKAKQEGRNRVEVA